MSADLVQPRNQCCSLKRRHRQETLRGREVQSWVEQVAQFLTDCDAASSRSCKTLKQVHLSARERSKTQDLDKLQYPRNPVSPHLPAPVSVLRHLTAEMFSSASDFAKAKIG